MDVGGSKTLAVLVSESGLVVARCRTGGANLHSVGRDRAEASLKETLVPLLSAGDVSAVCVGAAGLARESDREFFESVIRELVRPETIVLLRNDAQIALRSGTKARPAVAVIAGTGGLVYGERENGEGVRCGGYGAVIGDTPSAYAIGLAALKHVARVLDNLEERSKLSDAVLGSLRAASVPQLVEIVHHWPPDVGAIASLATLVGDATAAGDQASGRIVGEACRSLREQVRSVAASVRAASILPIIASGGAFDAVPELLDAVRDGAAETGKSTLQRPLLEPAHGAAFLALEAAGAIQTGP